jgi:hypothetical protein
MKNTETPDYSSISLTILSAWREQAEEEKREIQERLNALEKAIAERVDPAVMEARHTLLKDFGTVRVVVEGCEIVHDVPKRRDWDTAALEEQLDIMRKAGKSIDKLVTYKLSVGERELERLTPTEKRMVESASTLKAGKAKIKITEMEGV